MSFTLSTSNLTDTSVSIVMTLTSDYSTSQSVSMSVQEGGSSGSTVYSTTVTIPDGATTGDKIRTPISSLTASTTYYVATTISGGVIAADLTFTTRDTGYDTVHKVATQGQWEDLADRVQSKAEIGTVLSTPSNVAYVDTDNIIDEAVTADKIDFTTLPQSLTNTSNSYIQIGTILICWGEITATGIPTQAYGEKQFTVTFPKTYSKIPQIFCGVDDIGGYCGEYVLSNTCTTTKGRFTIGHIASTSYTSCRCGWIAIGAA